MNELLDDQSGEIVGLPLELIVIAVIMIIVIPAVWVLNNSYMNLSEENAVENHLNEIKSKVEEVHRGDPGNIRVVSIDASSRRANIEYMKIGGEEAHQLRYKLHSGHLRFFDFGGIQVSNFSDGEPVVRELPIDGSPFILARIEEGEYRGWIEVRFFGEDL